MRLLTCCTAAFLLLAASAFVHADGPSDAVRRVKAIAPYVEEHTMVVIHGDLTRADADAWFDFAARIIPISPTEIARAKKETGGQLRAALQAGVKDIYLTVTPGAGGNRGLLPTGYVVVPMSPGADVKAIRKGMSLPEGFGRVSGDAFVFPIPAELAPPAAQSAAFHPMARPELLTAFEAAGDTAVQIVVIPPDYASKIIEDLMPQFPKQLGGGSTKVLTRGISWAAVGLDLPPHTAVRLTIKSADAQAAEALRDKLADMLRMVGLTKEIRQFVPKFDEAAKMIVPKAQGDRLVLALDERNGGIGDLVSLLAPPIEVARGKSMQAQSMNNLKNVALAMLTAEYKERHFPLPVIRGKDGKPLLSWRVYILPYIDQDELFKQFHLDEPWDSPHNRTLIDKMPLVYRMPMSKTERGRTNYLLPVGGGAVFDVDKPTQFKDITDGSSNTFMVVEADDDHAVIWTKPEDLSFDPKDPTKGLGRFFNGGFNAVFCDGSVQFIPWPTDAKDIHRLGCLFMRADGEVVQRP